MNKYVRLASDVAQGKPAHLRNPNFDREGHEWMCATNHLSCEACGYKSKVITPKNWWKGNQIHHVKSFHEYPLLEMEPSNWIVLCEFGVVKKIWNAIKRMFGMSYENHCHLHFGHNDNWKTNNNTVRIDAAANLAKLKNKAKSV